MSIFSNGIARHLREHWQQLPLSHRLRRLADGTLRRMLRQMRRSEGRRLC